jgi:hypothetical protein
MRRFIDYEHSPPARASRQECLNSRGQSSLYKQNVYFINVKIAIPLFRTNVQNPCYNPYSYSFL